MKKQSRNNRAVGRESGAPPAFTKVWAMHTDEYEISIGREIALCRRMVRQLKDSLERGKKQCGMTMEAFLQALEEGYLSEKHPIQNWNQEYQNLKFWQKMLSEYEVDLESLKRL